jgi:Domain of unknown function (DUF4177)
VQRWEYRVVSFPDGRYTHALNEHGRDGWELVSVVQDPPHAAVAARRGRGLPVPRALERIEDAASKLDPPEQPPAPVLLWVLRRPLDDDGD